MRILPKEQVIKILKHFDFDDKLTFVKAIDFEPDCKIYVLKTVTNDKYALVCRDLEMDDLGAEDRILKNELGIIVLQRFVLKNAKESDYWYIDHSFDRFSYYFSLIRIL